MLAVLIANPAYGDCSLESVGTPQNRHEPIQLLYTDAVVGTDYEGAFPSSPVQSYFVYPGVSGDYAYDSTKDALAAPLGVPEISGFGYLANFDAHMYFALPATLIPFHMLALEGFSTAAAFCDRFRYVKGNNPRRNNYPGDVQLPVSTDCGQVEMVPQWVGPGHDPYYCYTANTATGKEVRAGPLAVGSAATFSATPVFTTTSPIPPSTVRPQGPDGNYATGCSIEVHGGRLYLASRDENNHLVVTERETPIDPWKTPDNTLIGVSDHEREPIELVSFKGELFGIFYESATKQIKYYCMGDDYRNWVGPFVLATDSIGSPSVDTMLMQVTPGGVLEKVLVVTYPRDCGPASCSIPTNPGGIEVGRYR